jgi:hypothetical protein
MFYIGFVVSVGSDVFVPPKKNNFELVNQRDTDIFDEKGEFSKVFIFFSL